MLLAGLITARPITCTPAKKLDERLYDVGFRVPNNRTVIGMMSNRQLCVRGRAQLSVDDGGREVGAPA